MSQIPFSSIPQWARPQGSAATEAIDTDGATHLLVGVGPEASELVERWAGDLGDGVAVRILCGEDAAGVSSPLRAALDGATVGVRVHIAGPVGACLALRGVAAAAGLEDDELRFTPVGAGPVDVFCAHCGGVTPACAAVDDVIACSGCERNLLVYHHVSRLTGHYLGFMIDAEEPPA